MMIDLFGKRKKFFLYAVVSWICAIQFCFDWSNTIGLTPAMQIPYVIVVVLLALLPLAPFAISLILVAFCLIYAYAPVFDSFGGCVYWVVINPVLLALAIIGQRIKKPFFSYRRLSLCNSSASLRRWSMWNPYVLSYSPISPW